jgi:dTDP-4-amino-4,6-dideoxygalactose transaminase
MEDQFAIPMSSPDITDAERQAVLSVLQTPNLSMGPQILAFEETFRDFSGRRHAIGVSSGTAGLHLCVRAAGIDPGDMVITTPFSFVASSNVLLFENAIPIFVDVDPLTGNIASERVLEAANDLANEGPAVWWWLPRRGAESAQKLKAILPVDVFGQPADLESIRATADRFSLKMIEDSCEALGATYMDCKAGTVGDFGVYAFYPNKQMTTGEGGVVVTDDDQAADLMRALRNQGRAPGDTWLQHTYLGYNYRLDELSAALGAVQMRRLEEMLVKRERVAGWYGERLGGLTAVEIPAAASATTRLSWFVYVIRFVPDIDRDEVARRLDDLGIPARPYFSPIHLQPYMVERFGYQPGDFPITEDLGKRSLAIPFSSVMTEDQVDRVCQSLTKVLKSL